LIRHLLQPVWDAFLDAAALSSLPSFPTSSELLSDRRTFAPVEWMTPEWEWVDPQSEQAAAKDAIESFMSDYQTELGARGRSWKAVMYQRAKENALKKKLGLLTPQEQQLAISAAQSSAQGQESALAQQADDMAQRMSDIAESEVANAL
jgi:capsid protein